MSANTIHPTAVIGPGVVLGEGNVIGPFVVLAAGTRVGDRNWFGPGVVAGTPGQSRRHPHPAAWESSGETAFPLTIGDDNVFREYATLHAGTVRPTAVGSRCYVMNTANVAHDAVIDDDVTLTSAVQLGGHTVICHGANLGLGAVVHQFAVIGAGAMVGMGSVVLGSVPPWAITVGNPAAVRGVNVVGMTRAGHPAELAQAVAARHSGSVRAGALPEAIEADFDSFDVLRHAAGR